VREVQILAERVILLQLPRRKVTTEVTAQILALTGLAAVAAVVAQEQAARLLWAEQVV
jgi:hypothetical protein